MADDHPYRFCSPQAGLSRKALETASRSKRTFSVMGSPSGTQPKGIGDAAMVSAAFALAASSPSGTQPKGIGDVPTIAVVRLKQHRPQAGLSRKALETP